MVRSLVNLEGTGRGIHLQRDLHMEYYVLFITTYFLSSLILEEKKNIIKENSYNVYLLSVSKQFLHCVL